MYSGASILFDSELDIRKCLKSPGLTWRHILFIIRVKCYLAEVLLALFLPPRIYLCA